MITLYGRKPVQEILLDPEVNIFRLHLADSNKRDGIISEILSLAKARNIEVVMHPKQALSRISKNGRQDQGVAIDIEPLHYSHINALPGQAGDLLVMDGITNPQNLGMVIRSVAASPMHGLLIPKKSNARIDPLVHKASAGTLLKSSLYHCDTIEAGLKALKTRGYQILGLDGGGKRLLNALSHDEGPCAFVLGNETTGLSDAARERCDEIIAIPLANDVESINVAMAATLVAFRTMYR